MVGISRINILAGVIFFLLLIASLVGAVVVGGNTPGVRAQATLPADEVSPTLASTVEDPTPTLKSVIVEPTHTTAPPAATNSICARIWDIQPPVSLPEWLQTPVDAAGLYSEVPYFILAGKLITEGIVNAGECDDNGLTLSGTASTCGMEKAISQVIAWQNQFDQEIFTAAQENHLPAQMIKRLFAQETQFWPSTKLSPPAYGIGNVTSPGVEPLFTWYPDVYVATCKDVFSNSCSQPYHSLTLDEQQLLRGYLISQYLHPYCPDCPYGMDIGKIKASIDYFAKLLVSNCYQVDLILANHGYSASTLNYADAWRLTLANYTVGAGCVNKAIEAMDISKQFTWDYFTGQLAQDCHVDIYVNRITGDL